MNKLSILMDRILSAYENEYFVIIGKNGEGKSQLLLDIIKSILTCSPQIDAYRC